MRIQPFLAMFKGHVMKNALPIDIDGSRVGSGLIDPKSVALDPLYRCIVIEPKLDLVIQPIAWKRMARLGPDEFSFAKQADYIINGITDIEWSEASGTKPFLNRE